MNSIPSSNIQLTRISERLEEVKGTMVETIDNIMERGQKLDVLVDKTDNLESTAFQFNQNAKRLRRQLLCKKIKIYSLGLVSVTIFGWFLSSIICGFDYLLCQH
jgi:vesicle-associated membrane protein 7